MSTIAILSAHSRPSSFGAALTEAYARGAAASGAEVLRFDASSLRFDPVLRGAYAEPMPDEPDLARVRRAIEDADHVAWLFPLWWSAPPAALKALVDRLFLPGWSFRYRGGLPIGQLKGRSARYISTMDSPWAWYWLVLRDPLGAMFGRGTLRFVGFAPVKRTLIHSVRRLGASARQRWLEKVEALGRQDAQAVPPR